MATTGWRIYSERHRVVEQARRLARSGEHADHTTILPLLEGMAGYEAARVRFEERAIQAQIDRLCAMAQNPQTRAAHRRGR